MDQDGPSSGGGWFQETALSFTGIVTIATLCCCTTMSCVALCIKLASWMFGHRGRRRRILLLPPDQQHYHRQYNDGEEGDGYPRSPRPIIIVGENSARQSNGGRVHPTEIELREVPFGNIEEQRRTPKTGPDGNVVSGKGASGGNREGDQRLNRTGKGLERDATNASMMTRTGTPSVDGEHRDISPSSSHGSQDLGDDDVDGGDGDDHGGAREETEGGGKGQGEENAERGMGE